MSRSGLAGHTGRLVHRLPIRVAAISTAIVALLYLAAGAAVVFVAGQNQMASLDQRIGEELSAVRARPDLLAFLGGSQGQLDTLDPDRDARRFEAPILVWIVAPDGDQYQSDPGRACPRRWTERRARRRR